MRESLKAESLSWWSKVSVIRLSSLRRFWLVWAICTGLLSASGQPCDPIIVGGPLLFPVGWESPEEGREALERSLDPLSSLSETASEFVFLAPRDGAVSIVSSRLVFETSDQRIVYPEVAIPLADGLVRERDPIATMSKVRDTALLAFVRKSDSVYALPEFRDQKLLMRVPPGLAISVSDGTFYADPLRDETNWEITHIAKQDVVYWYFGVSRPPFENGADLGVGDPVGVVGESNNGFFQLQLAIGTSRSKVYVILVEINP